MIGRIGFFILYFVVFLPLTVIADELPSISITKNTNPKIVELYQQLQDTKDKINKIQSERTEKLSENYEALKENEQSLENRTLTATTTLATGVGGMELAQGFAEQNADKDSQQDMDAYMQTFSCSYDGSKKYNRGETIELPGGNELFSLYQEYKNLAADLKLRKEALDMRPGIESEVIFDKADMGLYDNEGRGIENGNYASLYRAANGNEKDKAALEEMQETSAKRVKGGAIAAGAGAVGGIVGNAIINKDAPKNESKKINAEYDKQVAEATAEQDKLEKELNTAIAKNTEEVKEYNKKLQQHKEQIDEIKQSSPECQTLFTEYVDNISGLSPVESETDSVPDANFPDISGQKNLLTKCTTEYSQCNTKGGVFDAATNKCSCPEAKPIEKDGKCVEKPIEPVPNTNTVNEQITNAESVEKQPEVTINENLSEEEQTDKEETTENTTNTETGVEYCPATGNRLKSITDKTKIGDECSSTNIALGEVVWAKTQKPKTVCTCVASICNDGYHSVSGRCDKDEVKMPNCPRQEYTNVPNIKTGNDALQFCETKGGKQCKTINAIKDYTGIKGKVLCNAGSEEYNAAKQRVADSKLKYYNCGEGTNLPKGITCKFVQDFKREKVTPMEAMGLMKEYALKKYKDDIKCDEQSHRKSNDYRQCASRKNSKYFYEFEFKDLDAGNSGFTDALCLIWGLKGGMNLCKNANQSQCNEISAAVNRTFYIGGSAELKGTNCMINSHPRAESAPVALLNTKVLTKEDMRTVGNIDPLHFYDKKLQVNANSDVYKTITNYLFVEQRLPVKQFSCGAGFVDNTMYYNVSRQKYNETQEKIRKCQQDSQTYSGGGEHAAQGMGGAMLSCNRQYPLDSKSGDLLSCEYDGQPIDFLFQKLDVKWNRKSTAGYQGLRCLTEGGDFTGKSCTLASKSQCDSFNERFKKDYPNSKGMEWDEEMGTCVLKDAKYVSNVQKVAETTGMVALTLVTAVAGGPVVWALSVVEGAALVTEAVTEEKINDWAEAFLADAARCKEEQSSCANTVMKKHIARIMEGSNQFSETQNKQIAKQTERLLGMLDEKTVSAIVDKGESSGYIGEDRDPDLEKSIRAYYGTQLTSDEKRLLTTKKVATVATFATLIGGGIMAGLRQAFKHNWIHLSPEKQAKWLKLRILRPGDVTNVTTDAAKAVTHEMTPAQAKRLHELDSRIAVLEGKTNRTHAEAEELKKLHQERNTLLNKVGTKDADELAKLSGAAFDKKAVEEAHAEYKTARERYDYVRKYMSEHNGNPPSGTTKYDIQDINNNMAKAEKNLKDLGQDVTPVEQLQIGKKPSAVVTDAKPVEPKPAESTPKPTEDSSAKPADDVGRSTGNPIKSKAEKIAEAKQRGDLGYHGTDADIAMDDMIRPSANTSEQLGNVGYGIAQNYDDAEAYAVRRLIERQNPGASITFSRENGMLIITSDKSLQLTNKTGYVYTTAKESSVSWDTMYNNFGGWKAAKMPNSVEILEKKALNLDDMVQQGKLKIIEPKPTNVSSAATGTRSATRQAANTAANKADDVADATKGASSGARTATATKQADAASDVAKTANKVNQTSNATMAVNNVEDVATRFGSIKMLQSDEDIILDAIAKKRAGTLSTAEYRKAIRTMDKYFDEGQAVRYAQQMRQDIIESVRLHPDEFVMAWDNGEDIARLLVKYLGPKYGIKSGQLKVMSTSLPQGYAQYGNGVLYINSNLKALDFDQLTNLVVHEFGHAIDDLAPQYGVIGRSLNAYGDLNALYVKPGELFDGGTDMYRLIPTERSSHLLGDMVSGTTNYGATKSGSLLSKELVKVLDAGNISADEARIANIATLRQQASKSFDQYLAEVKNSYNGKGAKLPKSRLNDAGWNEVNRSLAAENVQLVETTENGKKYMQFVRANHTDDYVKVLEVENDVAASTKRVATQASKEMLSVPANFSTEAKNFIKEINEVGTTREYAVSRGIGTYSNQSALSKQETDYIRQMLNGRKDLIARNISQPNGSGGNLGANWFVTKQTDDMFVNETNSVFRRIATKPVNSLRGKSITTINGKHVFLETLDNGEFVGNVSGRPVVVVNYNGHRIPFYASSGSAGKLDVPTGKWEVFFGFGKNDGWFNKANIDAIVNHYNSPELKQIAEALDNVIGDQRNIEDVFATISRKFYNGKGNVARYDGPEASEDFINALLDFAPINSDGSFNQLLYNIEHVKGYFK